MSVEALFAPGGAARFLAEVYGRRLEHRPRDALELVGLVSWPELAGLLEGRVIAPELLGLVRRGEQAAPHTYLRPAAGGALVDLPAVERLLEDGATLFLARLHHLHRRSWELSRGLARVFREAVNANVYYGRPKARGFAMHVDHHDVLVVQVEGKKRWHFAEPTFPDPLVLPQHSGPPPSAATSTLVLETGDVLYLPRGTWHAAETLEETSLHVSFGIQPCTGIHFLAWLRERAMERPELRKDLPRYGEPAALQAHFERMREVVLGLWTPDAAADYVRFHEQRIERELNELEAKLFLR